MEEAVPVFSCFVDCVARISDIASHCGKAACSVSSTAVLLLHSDKMADSPPPANRMQQLPSTPVGSTKADVDLALGNTYERHGTGVHIWGRVVQPHDLEFTRKAFFGTAKRRMEMFHGGSNQRIHSIRANHYIESLCGKISVCTVCRHWDKR